jgi:hypothetical protein
LELLYLLLQPLYLLLCHDGVWVLCTIACLERPMGTLHVLEGAGLVLLLLVGVGNAVASNASTSKIACGKYRKEAKIRFVEMLRSDWSIPTSLLLDLQSLLEVLEGLVVSTEPLQSVADVAVRLALAALVACNTKWAIIRLFEILRSDWL